MPMKTITAPGNNVDVRLLIFIVDQMAIIFFHVKEIV